MTLNIIEPSVISGLSHRLTAKTLADLAQEITSIGPGIGAAEWKFEPNYTWSTKSGGGLDINLNMTLTLTMPVWMNVTERPEKEQREWRRWHNALQFHEDGHHIICRREVVPMYKKMQAASPGTIAGIFTAEKNRIKALNVAYDKGNGHGTTQVTPSGSTVMQVPPP